MAGTKMELRSGKCAPRSSRPSGFCASIAMGLPRRPVAEHRSQARASQASLHFPSRRDFIEGFDTALPGGVDSVVQVRHHAGVVGDDGDEFTNSGLSRSRRRAHMSVLFAEVIDLPVEVLEDATETFKPQQIR